MKVFDFVLLAIMLIGMILGYKKGFFGSITKPIKLIASFSLTVVIATPVLNSWTRPLFVEKVRVWIYDSLINSLPEISADATDSIPAALKIFAELFKVDLGGLDASAGTEAVINEVASKMALPIGNLIAVIVTYLALFLVILLLLKILIALLDVIFTKGLLGKINKILGLLLGMVVTTVVCCIIVSLVGKISYEAVAGPVCQFFMNFNPFSLLMKI